MVSRSSRVFAATLILTPLLLGQTVPNPQPATPAPGVTVLRTGTRIVVLDVVVQDHAGNPVHGLKAENFQLTEAKTQQQLRHVEEHTPPLATARGPELGPMPPGTFTDYTPLPPGSTLNVLLLDALNTPMMYQTWVRDQLRKYVKQAPPGQRIAIFGLTDHLILLQGFTSDPETLKTVIARKLDAKASPLLADPVGSGSNTQDMSDDANIASSPIAASLRQFEAEQHAVETGLRIGTTLDAFNALARYLAAFPGRKNILWFSGAFPSGVVGPANLLNTITSSNQIKETGAALASAQVAIYPIDARGLMTDPTLNASNSSAALTASNSRAIVNDMHAFSDSQAEEHATMESLAAETGGRAFYNTNGIADAVREAISSGANYYTLSYTPTDRNWNGNFRNISVKLVDATADPKLTYRPGYYATPPKQPKKVDAAALDSDSANPAAPDPARTSSYDRAALTRGAPTPQEVLFKVRVLPASSALEANLAPLNNLSPTSPAKGPFRRYDVDYALQPAEITFITEPNGVRSSQIKFTVFVYDREGQLLVAAHRNFNLNLKPDLYDRFIKANVQCHMEVSVPGRTETYLRIAVQDVPADRFGVVELPTASISRLPPPSYGAPASPKP